MTETIPLIMQGVLQLAYYLKNAVFFDILMQ